MSKLMIVIMAVAGLLFLTGLVYAAGQVSHNNMMMNHSGVECTNAGMNQNGDTAKCDMANGNCPMMSDSKSGICLMTNGTNSMMKGNCPMNQGTSAPAEKSSSCH